VPKVLKERERNIKYELAEAENRSRTATIRFYKSWRKFKTQLFPLKLTLPVLNQIETAGLKMKGPVIVEVDKLTKNTHEYLLFVAENRFRPEFLYILKYEIPSILFAHYMDTSSTEKLEFISREIHALQQRTVRLEKTK